MAMGADGPLRNLKLSRWIITGASGGLGSALTKSVVEHGGRVAALSRTPTLGPSTPKSESTRVFTVDLADDQSIRLAFEAAVKWLGGLDVLVNNAGYAHVAALADMSATDIRSALDVNLIAPLMLSKLALESFATAGPGVLVQISSVSATDPAAGMSTYAGAKAALEAASDSIAKEASHLGVKVIVVQAGGIRTNFAGPSLARSEASVAFAPSVNATLAILEGAHGRQPTEASEAAELIVHAVARGGSFGTARRLPIGADAKRRIEAVLDSRLELVRARDARPRRPLDPAEALA